MECIKTVDNTLYTNELVSNLTKLYTYKGKDFYYEEILKNFMKGIVSDTVERDVIFASKMLELHVTDARLKLLIRKDSNPKTKDEKIVLNLKIVFKLIQEMGTDLILDANEFLQLGNKIFEDKKFGFTSYIVKENHGFLSEDKRVSRRDDFNELIRLMARAFKRKIESTQVITKFFTDLINQQYFTEHNRFMAILITYCLLVSQRFNVFKYVSYFELYTNKMEEFNMAIAKANFGYKEGFSDTSLLNNEIINLMIEGYQSVENMTQDSRYNKDIKISKVDAAASAILSLGQNFTKEDIKTLCPYMSDSTINRALNDLKESGKIISNGTGRSATWTKLVGNNDLSRRDKQINIFDMIEE